MKNQLIGLFPGLSADKNFRITSPCTSDYNCIAWAAIKNDEFWWPDANIPHIDGITWPFGLPLNETLNNFISLYENLGYMVCSDWKYEDRFQKITIYINPTTLLVTHAARQNFNGIWTSKLGSLYDIEHTGPKSLEGIKYGIVSTFMKRPNSSYHIRSIKKFVEKSV